MAHATPPRRVPGFTGYPLRRIPLELEPRNLGTHAGGGRNLEPRHGPMGSKKKRNIGAPIDGAPIEPGILPGNLVLENLQDQEPSTYYYVLPAQGEGNRGTSCI